MYRVKVVNRVKKSEYVIKRLHYSAKFASIEELRIELKSIDVATKDFGYIEPGHGAKGKQHWLITQEDLDEMYVALDKKIKHEVLLWCYSKTEAEPLRVRKRPVSPVNSDSMPGSKRPNVCSQKLQKVEKIVKELQEKHKTSYTVEQLNAWAHLLQLG